MPLTFVHHKKKRYGNCTNQITGERYRIVVDKGISGLNNEIMADWVTNFLAQPQLNAKRDILCYNNHQSHLNEKILNTLLASGLSVIPFPKGAAADLSMLDNSIFCDFKHNFVTEYEKKKFTIDNKKKVANCVWNKL